MKKQNLVQMVESIQSSFQIGRAYKSDDNTTSKIVLNERVTAIPQMVRLELVDRGGSWVVEKIEDYKERTKELTKALKEMGLEGEIEGKEVSKIASEAINQIVGNK